MKLKAIIIFIIVAGGFYFAHILISEKGGPSSGKTTGEETTALPSESNVSEQKLCSEMNGFICEKRQSCGGEWTQAKDSDRCCSKKCFYPPLCKKDQQTGEKTCYCTLDETKNKVAIIIKKHGIYDNAETEGLILGYFSSVKKDLGIDTAGTKKFEGNNIPELDEFIDNLYLNENVAYIILIGEDLPVADITEDNQENLHAIYSKLEYAGREYNFDDSCRDLGISYILPPVDYSTNEKLTFVETTIKRYTDYHNNPEEIFKKFKKEVLQINHDPALGLPVPIGKTNYSLPVTQVFNSNTTDVESRLKEKFLIVVIRVHGSEVSASIGITGLDTTLEEFSNFNKENNQLTLFLTSIACQGVTIKRETYTYCCWPQIYLESGMWAYYNTSGLNEQQANIEKDFTNGEPIGYNIRKISHGQNFIFGDILAHYP